MSTEGPEKSEEKINILLGRIKDAETEFVISLKNYNRLTNPRLKGMAEERMNMLLLSIVRYAMEGIPKEYIGSHPDWIKNNQEKIQGWLKTEGISHSTITEVNQLIDPKSVPTPPPHAHAGPNPDYYRAQQQAAKEATERREREKAERDAAPEVVAERKRNFDSVINDPESILKEYNSILGASRIAAKFSAKGKESRDNIDKIVKLFKIFQNDHEADWQENAKAAYCYVKSIYDKYDAKFYGIGYERKTQDPIADACYNFMQTLARAVTADSMNVDNVFKGTEARDYVRRCEEKIQAFDNQNQNRPKRR